MGVPRKAPRFLWRTTLADDATLCRLQAAIARERRIGWPNSTISRARRGARLDHFDGRSG